MLFGFFMKRKSIFQNQFLKLVYMELKNKIKI